MSRFDLIVCMTLQHLLESDANMKAIDRKSVV